MPRPELSGNLFAKFVKIKRKHSEFGIKFGALALAGPLIVIWSIKLLMMGFLWRGNVGIIT